MLGKDPMKATCAILGHSVGEITGHCAAEGFSLEAAVKLAVRLAVGFVIAFSRYVEFNSRI